MIVELRSVPGCSNLDPVREALTEALADLGSPAAVIERVGDYPSPSVLINGVDVLGAAAGDSAACRLDLPTGEQLRVALRAAVESEQASSPTKTDR